MEIEDRDQKPENQNHAVRGLPSWEVRTCHVPTEASLVPIPHHLLEDHLNFLTMSEDGRLSQPKTMLQRVSIIYCNCKLIFESVLQPSAFYGMELWITGSAPAKTRVRKLIRRVSGQPWHTSNEIITRLIGTENIVSVAEQCKLEMIQRIDAQSWFWGHPVHGKSDPIGKSIKKKRRAKNYWWFSNRTRDLSTNLWGFLTKSTSSITILTHGLNSGR